MTVLGSNASGALFDHLVLDSAPLLQNSFPATLACNFYTCPGVVSEIKDEASRARLLQLPFKLQIKTPSAEASALVSRWARATGDLATLSSVDLEVLALVVTLELEANGEASRLLKDPAARPSNQVYTSAREFFAKQKQNVSAGIGADSKPKQRKGRNGGGVEVDSFDEDQKQPVDAASESFSFPDEGEWITPENVSKYKQQHLGKDTVQEWTSSGVIEKSGSVQMETQTPARQRIACISADFAVQNVLLQMRCELYTLDGCRVRRLKNWLLRCHACYHCTHDLEAGFCPRCGGPTLMRTSYMLDDLGQVHLFLKSDFEYRVRGTKYSIPKPVSGRHGDQDVLLLRADQKEYQRAKTHYNRVQGKLQRQAGQTGSGQAENLPLGFEGNTVISSNYGSKRTDLYDGLSLPTIGFGRRNPNANNRRKK